MTNRRASRAASTPRLPSAPAAGRPAYGHRWARSAMRMTTPCARASSPRWNASSWLAGASIPRPRRRWRSSASSRAGKSAPAPFRPRLSLARRLRGGPCRAAEPASQPGIKPMLERIPGRRRRQGHACGAPLRGLRSLTATTTRNRAYDRFDAALHARPNPSPKPSTKSGQAQSAA